MNRAANVESLESIEHFRAALTLFRHETDQALGTIRSELGRFVDWLEHDQLGYWKQEIRVREERLAEAKADLHRCLAATIDPHRTPSCYQEKKVVESCKRRFEEAEHKLARVRRWIPIVRQAAFEYTARAEPLSSALVSELPAAAAFLDRCLDRLSAYQEVALPAGAGAAQPASRAAAVSGGAGETLAKENRAAAVPSPADASAEPKDAE